MKEMSLKELVEKHGFNIRVQAKNVSCPPFTVICELDQEHYKCRYDDGLIIDVMKECPSTNDYRRIE